MTSPEAGQQTASEPAPAGDAAPGDAAAGAEQAADQGADVRRYRSKPIRDMVFSLGVILVPLVLLMAFCRPAATDAPRADPAAVFRAAQAAGTFPVLVPGSLPSGWHATNAGLRTAEGGVSTLRVTYLTPSQRFVQLVESNKAAEALLTDEVGRGRPRGNISLGGRSWQQYSGRRDTERALVVLQPRVTYVVAGDAPDTDLAALAGALR